MDDEDGKNEIWVVGMGLSAMDLTEAHLRIIRKADILVGGRRHLEAIGEVRAEKREISGRIDGVIEFIRSRMETSRIVVLASGDPLFFGIGHTLIKALGPGRVRVMPNLTSAAAAFARINEPWGEAAVVSLHGRNREFEVLAALKTAPCVAVLTDNKWTPRRLARWLIERGAGDFRMAVFEKMSADDESFGWFPLARAAEKDFAQPNVAILKPQEDAAGPPELSMGTPESEFEHEDGLITKTEARAVALSKLRLKPGLTLWDLGAGSGSVGIEASVLIGAGRVVAVEQNLERVKIIRKNAAKFGVYNHETVHARMPEVLASLPAPDRVFVGGGGRNLAAVIREAARLLNPGGVVVAAAVLLDNIAPAMDVLTESGLSAEAVQLSVSRSRRMPWSSRMEALNPVWIITGAM